MFGQEDVEHCGETLNLSTFLVTQENEYKTICVGVI